MKQIIKLKSKEIRKKAIDLDIRMYDLASMVGITYQNLNHLLNAKNISNARIGTVFKLAAVLKFENVYEILSIDSTEPTKPAKALQSPGTNILKDIAKKYKELSD